MGLFGGKKAEPKEGLYWHDEESTEDPDLVEVNRLHDSAREFRRAGDKRAQLIMEHHRRKEIDKLTDKTRKVVRYDSIADRWYLWPED